MKKLQMITLCFFVFGCAKYNSQSIDQASQNMTLSLGCSDMKSLVFDSFYQLLDQDQAVPSVNQLKEGLETQLKAIQDSRHLDSSQKVEMQKLSNELLKVVDLMLLDSNGQVASDWKEQLQKIIQYEMQDQSSSEIIATHTELAKSFSQIKKMSQNLDLSCEPPASSQQPSQGGSSGAVPTPDANKPVTNKVAMSVGLNRVFATAYQSCRVLDLPPMDASTSSVVGITRLPGTHEDGIGGLRVIGDLKAVQSTHYYVRGIATESSCVRVSDNPLIYDYGGSPSISNNTLNFFVNSGSGTKALGVDCSAFVSSAIAVGGLRYKPDLANKAIYTRQTSSKFISAAQSNFTCFENVTLTPKQSIKAGDIVGVKGHVVVVDRVGADPFGLNLIKSEKECSSISHRNFDIDVAQSSPSKGGIGINKYKASVYLDETTLMKEAFVGMAQQACLAKFQNKNLKPANTEWGFLRHKGTPECVSSPIAMVGESCTRTCQ